MEWVWIPALVVGLLGGFWLGVKINAMSIRDAAREMLRSQAHDQNDYLRVMKRELANHLVQRDPRAFERATFRLHDEARRYSTFSKDGLVAELRALSERYPNFSDFDLLGTRSHILYPDAFSTYQDEEVADHYRDIVRFQLLKKALDENWRAFNPLSDNDLQHLQKYVSSILDSRLKQKMKSAIAEFRARRGDNFEYESEHFSVRYVASGPSPDMRYGVHFKKTDEYGLYTSFVDDNSKHYQSYYASDETFEKQRYLDDIPISYEYT